MQGIRDLRRGCVPAVSEVSGHQTFQRDPSGEHHSCQTSGLTLNAVDHTGKQLDTQSRTWPNTERIKGWLGLYEVTGTSPWPQVESACSALFRFHLGPCVPEGLWVDAFTQDGRLQTATTPASTFYHILLAFCEILRLAPE